MRSGEGVLLALWLLIGGAGSAWVESQVAKEREPDWTDYAWLFGWAFTGPIVGFLVAGWLSNRPRSRP